MTSKLKYNDSGWLFNNPQQNNVRDINIKDIKRLILYAEQIIIYNLNTLRGIFLKCKIVPNNCNLSQHMILFK